VSPLVSIITPSFNQGQFLEETILSVLRQDYENIEYIIIDGGSSDNSVGIIKKYEDKLACWVSEEDDGQTDAILKGLKIAKGKYFSWLCSDDLIEPSMVRISVWILERFSDIVMTYGDRIRYDTISNVIGYHRYCEFRPWLLKWGFAIPQETSIIRREAYDKANGLDKDLKMALDFDLFCRLSRIGKIKHLPCFMGRFRSHSGNKSTIFDKQVLNSGFSQGYPNELSRVYSKNFNKPFPVKKWQNISFLNEALAILDRRSNNYKKEITLISEIRR
jgi:glycosyltransferase involved in cell wall biosynthesis